MEDFKVEFGKRLRMLRNASNKSLHAMAKEIGVSHTAISQYERGVYEPSFEIVIQFSRYFKVSVDYLLGTTKNKTSVDYENVIYIAENNNISAKSIECFVVTLIEQFQKESL